MKDGTIMAKKESGFTLAELIIIIAILGILVAISIPGFAVWLPRYRVKSAATDLYSNMQLTKLAAIKNNQNCSVTYSSSPDQYTVSCLSKTVVLGNYGSGVYFHGPGGETYASATITFNSRGLSNSAYAYLSNSDNSAYYRVSPLTSGVIRLQKWNGSSWE